MMASPGSDSAVFDPYQDRRSRDIRNGLSTAFIAAMGADDSGLLAREARRWRQQTIGPVYHRFIDDRIKRYDKAWDRARAADAVFEPFSLMIVLWNEGLFFEVHELLEPAWMAAAGPVRTALKGLIQAAGVYVHLAHGKRRAARKLAARSLGHLAACGHALNTVANISDLTAALTHLAPAPQLKGSP